MENGQHFNQFMMSHETCGSLSKRDLWVSVFRCLVPSCQLFGKDLEVWPFWRMCGYDGGGMSLGLTFEVLQIQTILR